MYLANQTFPMKLETVRSVWSYLIIFPYANRVDPDQAVLKRAACPGSALFAKVLKGASMS